MRSKALPGEAGRAPPTISPNLLREAIRVVINTSRAAVNIGRRESQVMGDEALTRSMSAFSSASSLRSNAEEVAWLSSILGMAPRQEREIALLARSKASCS